jgi:oxygen tolerance protein BatD
LLLVFVASGARAAVKAWVDSSEVAADGSIQLTLEHDGQISSEPDLAPLKQDFDVLSSVRSSSIQIVNGSVAASVQIQVTLSPKHGGAITIPSLAWGSDKTDPITVKFGNPGASNGSSGTNPPGGDPNASSSPDANAAAPTESVFIETSVESKQPYVQAADKMTVKIYSSVPLRHAALDVPSTNDVVVQQVGADRRDLEIKDGQRYQVVERHYQVFPQRSGQLSLPAPVLDGQIPVRDRGDPFADRFKGVFGDSILNNMLTSLKPIRVHGDALALNVLPRPGDAGDVWLPAQNVNLQGDWQPTDATAKVGDPVTWHLHLEAQGLMAAQLPDLNALLNLPPGLKAYPDQPRLDNDTHGDTVVGTRDQTIALIADQPGQYAVPPLTLHWWDTGARQRREITVPGYTFTISAAPAAAQNATDATRAAAEPARVAAQKADSSRSPGTSGSGADESVAAPSATAWRWVSAALGLLWVGTLLAWYLDARRRVTPTSEGSPEEDSSVSRRQARTAFHEACRRDDARAARANLICWLNLARPATRGSGLRALFTEANGARLTTLLVDLDRACFGGGGWSGAALLQALPDLPNRPPLERGRAPALAPLYP